MNQIDPRPLTTEQLVQQFVILSLEQDRAINRDETDGFNRLYDELMLIREALEARVGDHRHALLALYDHPSAQVRLNAAMATLKVAPEAARRMLEIISHSKEYPQAADAGMTIHALDGDVFKPIRKEK